MKLLFFVFTVFFLSTLSAQNMLKGRVVAKNEKETIAISGANIFWLNTAIGTISNEEGAFELDYLGTNDRLVISYLGYKTDTLTLANNKTLIHFLKEDEGAQLEGVTVSQGRKTIQKSYFEAQNVIRVNSEELLKAACCNLSESFDTNPSIDVSFSDALTGTKQIQMLGLTSPYILFAEENIPSVRGAAQAYGLTFTPGPWIESIQITKGAGSVVNGFESITGQINTELLKPYTAQPIYVNAFRSGNGRVEGNAQWAQQLDDRWHTGLFIHANQRTQRTDRNEDGFLDMPLSEQLNLLNRWQYTDLQKGWVGFLNFRFMTDEKQLGQLDFSPAQANSSNWGSVIETQRWDTALKIGKVNPKLTYRSWGLQTAFSHHDQNAFFGNRIYDIQHESAYLNLIYNSIIGNTNTTFKTGINATYDSYDEQVDSTPWTRTDRNIGAYIEVSSNSEILNWVAGVRVDTHNNLGTFVTPRFHLRYTPFETAIIRAAVGQGRKAANIFAEQQKQFGSNRQIKIRNNGGAFYGLQPEKAWNYGVSYRQLLLRGNQQADITFDYYITRFENQVVIDWETPGAIQFYNVKGESFANSFQVAIDYAPSLQWNFRLAYKNYRVETRYDSGQKQLPLQPKNRYFFNVGWESKPGTNNQFWRWDLTWHGLGQQRLVVNPRDGTGRWAPAYSLLNSQLTRVFSSRFETYLGAENIGDYRQVNAIVAADQPFGLLFDSTQIYAPVFGQMAYLGVRWKIK